MTMYSEEGMSEQRIHRLFRERESFGILDETDAQLPRTLAGHAELPDHELMSTQAQHW